MEKWYYTRETTSTNTLLKKILSDEHHEEGFVVVADFQSEGRGQGKNKWESEAGKNLLFSILLYPKHIFATEQFIISQIVSLAISEVLSELLPKIKIKWPNDIYAGDRKIAGILIENTIQGSIINRTIVGIGLNVNQTSFSSNAPNPVSLKQITTKSHNRNYLLKRIHQKIVEIYYKRDYENVRNDYYRELYRNDGFYPFSTEGEIFRARIAEVLNDGRIALVKEDGSTAFYGFKEVEFQINL